MLLGRTCSWCFRVPCECYYVLWFDAICVVFLLCFVVDARATATAKNMVTQHGNTEQRNHIPSRVVERAFANVQCDTTRFNFKMTRHKNTRHLSNIFSRSIACTAEKRRRNDNNDDDDVTATTASLRLWRRR